MGGNGSLLLLFTCPVPMFLCFTAAHAGRTVLDTRRRDRDSSLPGQVSLAHSSEGGSDRRGQLTGIPPLSGEAIVCRGRVGGVGSRAVGGLGVGVGVGEVTLITY